jgi:hypothetical protein
MIFNKTKLENSQHQNKVFVAGGALLGGTAAVAIGAYFVWKMRRAN